MGKQKLQYKKPLPNPKEEQSGSQDKRTWKLMQILLNGYLLFLGLVLPLYIPDHYQAIGYDKFILWRTVSVFVLACTGILYLSLLFQRNPDQELLDPWSRKNSVTDWAMLAYGAVITVSFVFAHDHEEALWGTFGWQMGWLTQMIILVFYFLYSRLFRWNTRSIFMLASGFFPVMLIQLIQRCGLIAFDNYLNEEICVSTIGNINWYCGYQAVMVSVLIGLFVLEDAFEKKRVCLYGLLCFFGLFSLILNGSNAVYLYLLAVSGTLLLLGLCFRQLLVRFFVLLAEFSLLAWIMNLLWILSPDLYRRFTVYEDNCIGFFARNHIGLFLAAASIFLILFLKKRTDDKPGILSLNTAGNLLGGILGLAVVALLCVQMTGIPYLPDRWGNKRGALWRFSRRVFLEFPFFRKLIGAGPDCYFTWYFSNWDYVDYIDKLSPGWMYANAHSEYLTVLINTGVFGLLSTMAVYFTSFFHAVHHLENQSVFIRKRSLITILSIAGTLAVLTVSFETLVLMPYLFLVFACEQEVSAENETEQEHGS